MFIHIQFVFDLTLALVFYFTIIRLTSAEQRPLDSIDLQTSKNSDSTPYTQSEFSFVRASITQRQKQNLALAAFIMAMASPSRGFHMERTTFQPIQPISINDVSNDLDIKTMAPPQQQPRPSLLTRRFQNKKTNAKGPTHLTIPILSSPPGLPPYRSIANAKTSFIEIFKTDDDVPFGILTNQPDNFYGSIPIIDANAVPKWERALLDGDFTNYPIDLTSSPSPKSPIEPEVVAIAPTPENSATFNIPEIPTTSTATSAGKPQKTKRKKRSVNAMTPENMPEPNPRRFQNQDQSQGQVTPFFNSPVKGHQRYTVEWGKPPQTAPANNNVQRQPSQPQGPVMNFQNNGHGYGIGQNLGQHMGQPQPPMPPVRNNNFVNNNVVRPQQQNTIAWSEPTNVRPGTNPQHQIPVSWNGQVNAQAQGYPQQQPQQQTRTPVAWMNSQQQHVRPEAELTNGLPSNGANEPHRPFYNFQQQHPIQQQQQPVQQQQPLPQPGFRWVNNNNGQPQVISPMREQQRGMLPPNYNNGQPQRISPVQQQRAFLPPNYNNNGQPQGISPMREQQPKSFAPLNNELERSQSALPWGNPGVATSPMVQQQYRPQVQQQQPQFQQQRFQKEEPLRFNFPSPVDRPNSAPGWAQGQQQQGHPFSRPQLLGQGVFNNGRVQSVTSNWANNPLPSPNPQGNSVGQRSPTSSPWNEYSRPPPFEWRHPMVQQQNQHKNMQPNVFNSNRMNGGQQQQNFRQNFIDPRQQFPYSGQPGHQVNQFQGPMQKQVQPSQVISPQTQQKWQHALQQQNQNNGQNFRQQITNENVNNQPGYGQNLNPPPSYGQNFNNPPNYGQHMGGSVSNRQNMGGLVPNGQHMSGSVPSGQHMGVSVPTGQPPQYGYNMGALISKGIGEPNATTWPVSTSNSLIPSSNQNNFVFPTVSGNDAGTGIPPTTASSTQRSILPPSQNTPEAPVQRSSFLPSYTTSGATGPINRTNADTFGQVKFNNNEIINQGLGSGGKCINCADNNPVSRSGSAGQSSSNAMVGERNDASQPIFANPTQPEARVLPPARIPLSFYSQSEVDAHYRRVHENHQTIKDMEFENDRAILQQNLLRAKQILRQHKSDQGSSSKSNKYDDDKDDDDDRNGDGDNGSNPSISRVLPNGKKSEPESERSPSPGFPVSPRPSDFGLANLSSNESISRLARGGRIRRQSSGIDYYVPEFY